MTRYEPITIPLVGGIDTKTDEAHVERLADLRNGRFSKRRSVTPRPSFRAMPKTARDEAGALADIAAAHQLLSVKDSMWLLDGDRAYSWSPDQSNWRDGGVLDVVSARVRDDGSAFDGQVDVKMAHADGRTLFVYTRGGVAGGLAFYSLRDEESGAWIYYDVQIASSLGPIGAVAVGLYLWVLHTDSTAGLSALIIAPDATRTTVQLAAAAQYYDPNPLVGFAAFPDASIVVAWKTDTVAEFRRATWTNTGAVLVAAVAETLLTEICGLAVAVDDDGGRFGVAVLRFGAASNWVQARIYNPTTLAAVTVLQNIDASATLMGGLGQNIRIAACWERDNTGAGARRMRVWYGQALTTTGGLSMPTTFRGAADSDATTTAGVLYSRQFALAANPWRVGASIYVLGWMGQAFEAQRPPYVLLRDLGNDVGTLVGQVMAGVSGIAAFGTSGAGSQYILGAAAVVGGKRLVPLSRISTKAERRFSVVEFDYEDAQGAVATVDGYLSGALVQRLDEAGPTEVGFMAYPVVLSAVSSNGVGTLTNAAQYAWTFYWAWEDEDGRYERSTFGAQTVLTLGAADDTVTFTLATLPHTRKRGTRRNIRLEVFRSLANAITAEKYRVSGLSSQGAPLPSPTYQDPTLETVTFVDTLPDATVVQRDQDEAQLGLLDAVPPPPSSFVMEAKQRLWGVSGEFDNVVWYSTTDSARRAAWNEALIARVPAGGGRATALAQVNEQIVVFAERRTYVIAGDGPNNTGTLGEFSTPQLVSGAWGCVDPRSVIQTEAGVYFRSERGMRLLNQSLQVVAVGDDVQAYDDQEITSAVVHPDGEEVLFQSSSGRLLLHDYGVGQWATWEPIAGVGACIFDGRYHYATADGTVYEEIGDDEINGIPFEMLVETGWLRAGVTQGLMLVRKVGVMGRYLGPHLVRVRPAYDYVDAFSAPIAWDPSSLHGTGPMGGDKQVAHQVIGRLARSKCQAIKLQIYFEPVGASRGMALSDVTLEVGQRRGMARLGAGNTR